MSGSGEHYLALPSRYEIYTDNVGLLLGVVRGPGQARDWVTVQ